MGWRCSWCAHFACLATVFAIVTVNALGPGHFHAHSGEGHSHTHSAALNAEHDEHEPQRDDAHGCDFCWLQSAAKTTAMPQLPGFALPDGGGHAVQLAVADFSSRSFLDSFSFLVRGPPEFFPV